MGEAIIQREGKIEMGREMNCIGKTAKSLHLLSNFHQVCENLFFDWSNIRVFNTLKM